LGDLGEFLFGLCFCDDCREVGKRAGVDVDSARDGARAGLNARFEGRLPADVDVAGWLAEHSSVAQYANARRDVVTAFLDDVSEEVSPADLGYYLKMGGLGDDRMGVEHSWKHGLDLRALGDVLDYATVLAYHSDPTVVRDDVATARTLLDAPVEAGILAGYPLVESRDRLCSLASAAADAGAEKLSFYGYGVLPERNLDWIGAALDRVR
jgi:hypothetical protein